MPSSSSSSASSASISPKKYEVFISFRGEDTRCDFVSHLHESLCRNKIETYIDYRLEKGDEVWPSLVKAIQESMVFLIVFSENYASSTWCLNELTLILECSKEEGVHAIPVFYKIDPSHIRKQKGSYEIAFRNHEQSNHKEQLHKWRTALTQAANISGWDSTVYRNEAEFIKEIVNDVLMKLDLLDQGVYSDGLVGIHEQMAHVESMLMCNDSQVVRFFGIWGMGGIGKTTIAKALFNKLCIGFESFCFLANVREECEKFGIEHLKNKLLSTLLEDKVSYRGMPDGGSTFVRRRLGRKKVLVVLDDINDSEQLKNLAGSRSWFGQGSRVIITTRDKQVLGKNIDDIYEVKELKSHEALQLFKFNAFEDCCCDEKFHDLSKKVVCYASGIPLAVIVLGSFLYGKDENEWESQLEKLKKMPNTKIQQILKLSYDGLDREEKNIFLFVACFFKGRKVEHIKTLLDAYGCSTTIGLKSLQNKALLTTTTKGNVTMHDLIQEMGLEIVREESLDDPGKRSRLSDPNDIYQVLKDNKGSEAIKSIIFDMSKVEDLCLSPQVFAKMPNLVFLQIWSSGRSGKHRLYLPQGLGYLSNELRYLHWDNYPLKSLPLAFSSENLVELRMPGSRVQKLWHGVQNVVNLKKIHLPGCEHLTELPDFSRAKNLKSVCLNYCTSIREVHPSILSLNKLESLQLRCCVALTSLKSDIQLKSLDYLSLDGCSNLKEFSVPSDSMKRLGLRGTAINELPSSIGCLSKLESLILSECKILKNIQGNLFDGLNSLRILHLNDCFNISEVVDHICFLSIKQLTIEESSIESLPTSIKCLSSLECLELIKCKRLRSLPQLPPSLISLLVLKCSSLQTVEFTSTVPEAEQFSGYDFFTRFQNCLKLDKHSVKAILANAMVKFNKILSKNTNFNCKDPYNHHRKPQVMYSGSHVPEWFIYTTPHDSITIDISSAPLSLDWGLLYCFVASPPSPSGSGNYIEHGWLCNIQVINDEKTDESSDDDDAYDEEDTMLNWCSSSWREDVRNFTSDHVYLGWDGALSHRIHQIKEHKATSNSKILVELIFYSSVEDVRHQSQCVEIKECGACPTYSWEYQNFMNELEKESQASTSQDEEETVPLMQKSKDFIFPPRLPFAATWNNQNQTQGLKDIINL